MIRTILIDDEINIREMIADIIETHCPKVKVIAQASGVISGHAAINSYSPDLVLLDIKMEDGTGFDLLERLDDIDFKIIFVTAFEEFAVKAFKLSAIDYVLKPVDPDDLIDAIHKAESIIQDEYNRQLGALKEHLSDSPQKEKKIVLKTAEKVHFVEVNKILRCESDRTYTFFYFTNGKRVLVSKPLKEYDELLGDSGFFRLHKSHLVNLKYVTAFEKADGGYAVMHDSTKVPVSFRKKDDFLKMMESI
jgi:two-component system LytT family response regulator